MSLLDDVEKHRNGIVTDTYTVTWRELCDQYKDGELTINPDYQRLFRWDMDQQTQYLESVLLNIPSPPLILARRPGGDDKRHWRVGIPTIGGGDRSSRGPSTARPGAQKPSARKNRAGLRPG